MKKKAFALLFILFFAPWIEVYGQGQFVGSKNSDVYHYPSCSYAQKIKPENLITFESAQDAVNKGYHPCSFCDPPLPDSQETNPEPTTTEPTTELTPAPPTEDIITVFVNDVIDGDTFDTAEGFRIRLADIDAPETGETGYLESAEYLELLIEDKTVVLDIDNITVTDPYGRYVCLVFVEKQTFTWTKMAQAFALPFKGCSWYKSIL